MATTIADVPRNRMPDRRGALTHLSSLLEGHRALLAAAVVYLAYALFVTWPLATNISGQLSAPNLLEDGAGSTSYLAYLVAHHMSPFLAGNMSGLNAPSGVRVSWALNLAQAPTYLLWWLLALAFGPVAGVNLFTLLGFVLSGVTMFALARRLFGSRMVALLAGFAFAFYPFTVDAASVHYDYVHGWPLLLCVWGLIEMVHRPSPRTALRAGLATAFAMWWNPYNELLGAFAFATCVVLAVAVGAARSQTRAALRAVLVAALPVAALGVFFAILLRLGGGLSTIGTARPLSQVYAFSAHLWNYVLPGPFSLIFGHLTAPFLTARFGISDAWDSAIYPGYLVVLLAIGGFVSVVRGLRSGRVAIGELRVVAVLACGALAVVAFVSSGPPSVALGGLHMPLPSGLIYAITPSWQTFSRFVMLLEPALICMMAAELARVRRRLDTRRAAAAMAIIGLLLAADLWARPPQRTVSTTPPPAYAWLGAHPGGTVADYPLLPGYAPANARSRFWQAQDGHPLLTGYAPFTVSESEKLDLADLASPLTAAKLAAYGVRYIVVHGGTPGGSPALLRHRGYEQILRKRTGPTLWRVPTRPPRTSVDAQSGFSWEHGYPTYDRRLLLGTGALSVRAASCRACTGTVSFTLSGVDRVTRLTVRDAGSGAVLAVLAVPSHGASTRVRVPNVPLRGGRGQLDLETVPSGSEAWLGLARARLTLSRP